MSTFQIRTVDNNIKGRLALITGASGGIGSACARKLAASGCDLALHYSSSPGPCEDLASSLRRSYPDLTITTHQASFDSTTSTSSLIPSILSHPSHSTKHESISILICNAGRGKRIRDITDIPIEEFDDMLNVNLKSSFIVTKACVEGMKAQKWGRIVLVSSIAAHGGGINGCHYAASKGGLTSMGKNLSSVLAPWNINVNIVSPALIGSTGMVPAAKTGAEVAVTEAHIQDTDDLGLKLASTIPLGRLGEPDEVADAVLMFASNGFVTGQDLVVGGGLK